MYDQMQAMGPGFEGASHLNAPPPPYAFDRNRDDIQGKHDFEQQMREVENFQATLRNILAQRQQQAQARSMVPTMFGAAPPQPGMERMYQPGMGDDRAQQVMQMLGMMQSQIPRQPQMPMSEGPMQMPPTPELMQPGLSSGW